jgi:hypothetical protein
MWQREQRVRGKELLTNDKGHIQNDKFKTQNG